MACGRGHTVAQRPPAEDVSAEINSLQRLPQPSNPCCLYCPEPTALRFTLCAGTFHAHHTRQPA